MPSRVEVMATLRADRPVAVLVMTDVLRDQREIHLSPDVARDLMVGLAQFIQQIGGTA